jgi:hypothetical protein
VSGIESEYRTHGYCSTSSWIRKYEDSKVQQRNGHGTLHPTAEGHQVYARHIARAVAPKLGLRFAKKTGLGDFNGDALADIALLGGVGWGSMPVAFSAGDGRYAATNQGVTSGDPNFPAYATQKGAQIVTGDFNNDGKADIALAGGPGWASIPVAFSNGDGSWRVTNLGISSGDAAFLSMIQQPNAKAIAGDFNSDGKADIALSGGNWTTIPIAFSNGDGSFRGTNLGVSGASATWTNRGTTSLGLGPTYIPGDFDGDGKSDILLFYTGSLVGGTGGVVFSNGDGSFRSPAATPIIGNSTGPGMTFFGNAFRQPVMPVPGDFNGDGKTDVAFTGNDFTTGLPVIISTGNGQFTLVRMESPGTTVDHNVDQPVPGDFDGDGYGDIAVTGGNGTRIRTFFSNGDGSFRVTSNGTMVDPQFPVYARQNGATAVSAYDVPVSAYQFTQQPAPNGGSCGTDVQCASGHCVYGKCCDKACAGPCNVCNQGVCQPEPARKHCGTRTLTSPGNNDLDLICDGAGRCVGPTIRCGSSPACDLTTSVCCNTAASGGVPTCAAPEQCCGQPGVNCPTTDIVGENCMGTKDCSFASICCVTGGRGFKWNKCAFECSSPNATVCEAGGTDCYSLHMTCAPDGPNPYNVCQ